MNVQRNVEFTTAYDAVFSVLAWVLVGTQLRAADDGFGDE
jgi:hypothetical protein